MGAEPAIADGLDAPAIRDAVIAAKPDIIIDEMTDLADVTDLRHFDRAFAATNRLRTEGTDFLLAAAREAGVRGRLRSEDGVEGCGHRRPDVSIDPGPHADQTARHNLHTHRSETNAD